MRTLKDLEDAYSFMRDPAIWDAIQIVKERDKRIEQLEAALRPFAELGEAWLPVDDSDDSIWVTSPDHTPVNNLTYFGFNFGHFRAAARAALAGEKNDE